MHHTTLGRTPLYEWSARRRYFYLITHNTHNRQTPNPTPGGIRTRNPNKRAATEIGPDFNAGYISGIRVLHVLVWVGKFCNTLESVPSVRTCSHADSNQNFYVFVTSALFAKHLGSCLGTDVFRIIIISAVSMFLPCLQATNIVATPDVSKFH